MRRFVIASHRTFAEGLKDSLDLFTNQGNKIITISAYTEENDLPEKNLEDIFNNFGKDDEVIIMTDILSGSVTQKLRRYINKKRFLVTGINMPLALSLMLLPEKKLTTEKIQNLISESKQQIVLLNNYRDNSRDDDE